MAIRKGSKVETSFGASAMTDLMFLLLIFLMVAITLINTNALKILLPKGSNEVSEKPQTTITITDELVYYVNKIEMPFEQVESRLQEILKGEVKPVVMLNIDKRVTVDEFVKVSNIGVRNNYKFFLMIQP